MYSRFISAWDALSDEVSDNSIRKGFHDRPIEDGTLIALIHSELSEALEALRQPDPYKPDKHCPNFSAVEVELADAVIRIMDYARIRGFRVSEAMCDKIVYNRGRPRMHGGKRF